MRYEEKAVMMHYLCIQPTIYILGTLSLFSVRSLFSWCGPLYCGCSILYSRGAIYILGTLSISRCAIYIPSSLSIFPVSICIPGALFIFWIRYLYSRLHFNTFYATMCQVCKAYPGVLKVKMHFFINDHRLLSTL